MPSDLVGIPVALICSRTDDPLRRPIEGSEARECHRCQCQVMVSPALLRRKRECDVILCIECMAAVAEERGEKWIDGGRNEEQLRELAANGYEPRQFVVTKTE